MSHDDIWSLFVHQSSKPDVLPSPARAPSVPRISRIFSWGSFFGKETCHHFEDSEDLWSFKTGPLWSIGSTQRLKINCGMQCFHQLHVERKGWMVANSSMMCLKIWEEFGGRWCHLNSILLRISFSVTSHTASTTVSKARGLTKAPPVVLGNVKATVFNTSK